MNGCCLFVTDQVCKGLNDQTERWVSHRMRARFNLIFYQNLPNHPAVFSPSQFYPNFYGGSLLKAIKDTQNKPLSH